MQVFAAGSRLTKRGTPEWFTGAVWQDPIVNAPEPARVNCARVTFEPGARTFWHTHPFGQALHVVAGVGRVQLWGEPVREIRAGDSVWIGPGEKHWHGAAPDTLMAHIAIQEARDGKYIEPMEEVSDQDYRAKPA